MKCDLYETSEVHRTGRKICRCRRCWCKQHGLLPPSGNIARLHAECRGWPRWHEAGHWLSLMLSAVLITPAFVAAVKQVLGLQPKCNCDQRAAALNAAGAAIAGVKNETTK